MSVALEVWPLGADGQTAAPLRADPDAGTLIKEERRTLVWRQPLPDGTPAVWKLYRHRKPSWPERQGLYTGRAEREFRALRLLQGCGVPCSLPLFWARGQTAPQGRYDLLVTREVEGAVDLREWLRAHPGQTPPNLSALFAAAAAMHRAGLQHGALAVRNVLLAGEAYFLIDLPRSQTFGRSIEGRTAGLFDLRLLLQNLCEYLPDEPLVAALAGYRALPVSAEALVREARTAPMSSRRLNQLHAVFTLQAGWSRRIARGRSPVATHPSFD